MGHRGSSRTFVAASIVALLLLGVGVPSTLAAATLDLDQWASSDKAWQNGNLNGNNSRYPEGGIVPFRLAIEGLKPDTHTIHINYDFTAGGHKAYDFLATWNVTNAKDRICAGSGGAISSMCPNLPSSSSAAFPSDGFKANGLSVKGAEQYSGAPRRLTIWGGTIASISGPDHSGSPNGNSTADFLVTFKSTGSAVLLAWGGHLAQSAYWDRSDGGASDGASRVSGAPWHMHTLQLDGSGNKNQDRSIQPSAIVGELPPQALAPTPAPTPVPRAAAPTPVPRAAAPTPRPVTTPRPGAPTPPSNDDPPGDPNAPGRTPFVVITPPPTSTMPPTTRSTPATPVLGLLCIAVLAGSVVALAGARRTRAPRGR